jgi:hypothetical protein
VPRDVHHVINTASYPVVTICVTACTITSGIVPRVPLQVHIHESAVFACIHVIANADSKSVDQLLFVKYTKSNINLQRCVCACMHACVIRPLAVACKALC